MELYAVKYGENFKLGTYHIVFRGHTSKELIPGFVFLYFIARFDNKIILFDTGFRSKKTAEYYGVDLIDVQEEVKQLLGGKKADVIFITHSHFDHSDNLDLYPDSDIYIARAEYETALDKYQGAVRHVLLSNKIHVIENEFLYEGKFLFRIIGGHTPGSSVIYFKESGRNYVITGDECYSCDNINMNIPNGNVCDGVNNIEFIADAHNRGLISLPFHDNRLFELYQPVSENIVRII